MNNEVFAAVSIGTDPESILKQVQHDIVQDDAFFFFFVRFVS